MLYPVHIISVFKYFVRCARGTRIYIEFELLATFLPNTHTHIADLSDDIQNGQICGVSFTYINLYVGMWNSLSIYTYVYIVQL